MDKEIQNPETNLAQWEKKLDLVKSMCAQDADDDEFEILLHTARKYNLDPLVGQIYLQKYKKGNNEFYPAKIIITRDGFLNIAHQTGLFDGIESYAITEDKELKGFCEVWNKNMSKSVKIKVKYREYYSDKNQLWKSKPETMITKVAESQALRRAFNITGGYDESEIEAGHQKKEKDVTHLSSKKINDDLQKLADLAGNIRKALIKKFGKKGAKNATEFCKQYVDDRGNWDESKIISALGLYEKSGKKDMEPEPIKIEDIPEEIRSPCFNINLLNMKDAEVIELWEQCKRNTSDCKLEIFDQIFGGNAGAKLCSTEEVLKCFFECNKEKWSEGIMNETNDYLNHLSEQAGKESTVEDNRGNNGELFEK
jgi:phage recombination protein Bet